MAEYERYQSKLNPAPDGKEEASAHHVRDFFSRKHDWAGWGRVTVVCVAILAQNLFTYSARQQSNADTVQQLQDSVKELHAAVLKLTDDNRDLRDTISKQNAYMQRIDQHSADAIERLLRLETYTYGRELKR